MTGRQRLNLISSTLPCRGSVFFPNDRHPDSDLFLHSRCQEYLRIPKHFRITGDLGVPIDEGAQKPSDLGISLVGRRWGA